MDLALARRHEYAVRLALELARDWPRAAVSAAELAERTRTPGPEAALILDDLVQRGVADDAREAFTARLAVADLAGLVHHERSQIAT